MLSLRTEVNEGDVKVAHVGVMAAVRRCNWL